MSPLVTDLFAVEDAETDDEDEYEPEHERKPPAKPPDDPNKDYVPMTFGLARTIHNHEAPEPFLVLFDPGTEKVWINANKVPKNANRGLLTKEVTGATMAGTFKSKHVVNMKDVCFPEFHRGRQLDGFVARVFDAPCRYDLIVGRSLLSQMGLILDFKEHLMTWDDVIVPMKDDSPATKIPGQPPLLRVYDL